jgi:hypothetical protein
MAEIVQFPRIVNVVPAGTNAHSEMVQVTPDGSLVLTDRARESARGDWTNQELAELYRVESILLQANIRISAARGVTDENDPWFVFCRENGDVFLHMARIDGLYILDGYGIGSVISGVSFKSLINQFVERSAVREGADNVVQLKRSVLNSDVIRLHPTVMLAALVWTLYLSSTEWMGVAHAADEIAAQPSDVSYEHFSAITGFQAQTADTSTSISDVVAAPKFSAEINSGQKSEGRDQFHNFYAFLALHGVALGIPVALSEITSPTVTVPQTSESDTHSFHITNFISFGEVAEGEQGHSFKSSTKNITPVVEFEEPKSIHSLDLSYQNKAKVEDSNANHPLSVTKKLDFNHVEIHSNAFHKISIDSAFDTGMNNPDHGRLPEISAAIAIFLSKFENNNHFKIDGVELSTTLNSNELQSILPQISGAISFVDAQAKAPSDADKSISTPAETVIPNTKTESEVVKTENSEFGVSKDVIIGSSNTPLEHEANTKPSSPANMSAAPQVVIGGTSQYNAAANSFVSELVSKADSVEMVKVGTDIVLVDMTALDEQTDLPYMRTWVTDAGFRISTIGHVSDFVGHGLI